MVFDREPYIEVLRKALEANPQAKVSSLYDLLSEEFGAEGLPRNEQTLRNNVRGLRERGVLPSAEGAKRVYDIVGLPPAGKQLQLDYGEERLNSGERVHFICLILSHSHLRWVRFQDHRFDGEETCRSLFSFFLTIGGRPEEIVLDQDACLVAGERFGEVRFTESFRYFLQEQGLSARVCRKSDPESKGLVENTVKYVKTNYLGGRMGWSAARIAENAAAWTERANKRIDRGTYLVPQEEFESVEKPHLKPLVPSAYSVVPVAPVVKMHAGPEHSCIFRTNRYILPAEYARKDVWLKILPGKLLFYADEGLSECVCRPFDLPDPSVKHATFGADRHYGHRDKPSPRLAAVLGDFRRRYPCPSLQHFVNGVSKENPRYRVEQFTAILDLVGKSGIDRDGLERVLAACCENSCYKLTSFEMVLRDHLGPERQGGKDRDGGRLSLGIPEGPRVENRPMSTYAQAFLWKVSSGNAL